MTINEVVCFGAFRDALYPFTILFKKKKRNKGIIGKIICSYDAQTSP